MRKAFLIAWLSLFILGALISQGLAADKVKLGTAIKVFPPYYLPILAAEERGFWKQNNLEVEWVPFRGSVPLHQALAAKSVNIATDVAVSVVMAASRGLPLVVVAELVHFSDFFVWVHTDGPIKKPEQLKGAKLAVSQLAGPSHAYARAILKAYGLENEVRYVGTAGIRSTVAMFKSRAVDAAIMGVSPMLALKVRGEIKELLRLSDHLPKPWISNVVFARKDFIRNSPNVAQRMVRSIILGASFAKNNQAWTLAKMKAFAGLSEAAARLLLQSFELTDDGKIDPKGAKNIRNFLIEYRLVPEGKMPPVRELFTREFTG